MLLGHQKQLEFLKKSVEQNKLAHAYLFSGQEKLGKKKVALEFISWLFGTDIGKGVHPDFIFLEPAGKEIQISQIRELSWRLSLKSFSAPFKAAIIDKAHSMNFEAQSCLLKTLEEPKGKTILILVTSHPRVLLPTIISRCQTIRFFPVSDSEIMAYLISKGAGKAEAKEIVQISLGRPGLALDFLSEPQKIENYRKVISDFVKIFNADISFRFQYVKKLSQNANPVRSRASNGAKSPLTASGGIPLRGTMVGSRSAGEILEIWLWYLRKTLISKIQGREDANFKNFSLARLKNLLEFIQRTIFLTSTKNINQRLALENLMLEI